ncbi:hypothetical protein ACQ86D_19925 [Streptomyces galilaeus]
MLPSDSGSGAQPSSWVAGVFDAMRDAVDAQADMATELSSFTGFQKRIDGLIHDLKGSDAGPGKVGQEQLTRHELGGGDGSWTEAAGLFTAYGTVISELGTLSKLLSDSMEGMNIAVLASHKGYQNIDVDVRDRMTAISAETTKHYSGDYAPGLPKNSSGNNSGNNSGNSSSTASGSEGDAGGTI